MRAGEELVEAELHLSQAARVGSVHKAVVPLHGLSEGGKREVGAAHVGAASVFGIYKNVGFGVKASTGLSGLEDSELKLAWVLVGEVEESFQSVRVGDVEVVAGDQPTLPPALEQKVFEGPDDAVEAGGLEKGDGEIGPFGRLEILEKMGQQGVVAAGDEGVVMAVKGSWSFFDGAWL